MNLELVGMSNEELIQWACKNSTVEVKELRKMFPSIEAYCARTSFSVYEYLEALVRLSNTGIKAARAGRMLRRHFEDNSC